MAINKPRLVRIRILKSHWHGGKVLEIGDFLDIPAYKLGWFETYGIGEEAKPASKEQTKTELPSDPLAAED